MRKILIVDDSIEGRELLKRILNKRGYPHIITAGSAEAAFEILEKNEKSSDIDLVLLDIVMPGMDGIEACTKIKKTESLKDIPVIMVTGMDNMTMLEQAFRAGAMDYIKKPYSTLELTARVRNALKFKQEMDQRKSREIELIDVTEELKELNKILEQLSNIDGLTGVANRRSFDMNLKVEWNRAKKTGEPLSLILFDLDKFKIFNDTYGHQEGDDCLKRVAKIFRDTLKDTNSIAARYGGEEFAAVLPNTSLEKALRIAEQLRANVENASIRHENSTVSDVVTISIGVATIVSPTENLSEADLITLADQGLYYCKNNGRNQVSTVLLNEQGVKDVEKTNSDC